MGNNISLKKFIMAEVFCNNAVRHEDKFLKIDFIVNIISYSILIKEMKDLRVDELNL
jgi:hypothetical protein